MNRKIKYVFILLYFTIVSCNSNSNYFADWVLVEAKYKGGNILEDISMRNMMVSSDKKNNYFPSTRIAGFSFRDSNSETEIKYFEKEGYDYILIDVLNHEGDFFEDTFLVKKMVTIQ